MQILEMRGMDYQISVILKEMLGLNYGLRHSRGMHIQQEYFSTERTGWIRLPIIVETSTLRTEKNGDFILECCSDSISAMI